MKRCLVAGFTSTDGHEIIKFLKSKSSDDIVEIMGVGFSPVLDHYFFKDMPENLYAKGSFKPVDHIIGFNSDEGTQFIFAFAGKKHIPTREEARTLVKHIIEKMFFRGSPNMKKITEAAIDQYVDSKPENEMTQSLVDLYGDMLFVASSVDVAGKHSGEYFKTIYVSVF